MKEKRWVAIASSIRSAIRKGELSPGARIPSESDMALQWNVSHMTVHQALSELQREGWVVRKPKVGTVVADRSAQPDTKVGLVFTGFMELPQGGYLAGIESSLTEGFQFIHYNTNASIQEEAKCLEAASSECGAVICYPISAPENTPLLRKIAASMPLVFVDRIPQGIDADVVMSDNFASMVMGLRHLHTLGHSRIAFFMEDQTTLSSVTDRYAGYQQFMRHEAGVPDPERWVRRIVWDVPWEQYYEQVETNLIELLSAPERVRVTAIACQQYALLGMILEVCVNLGVSVPGELALLSFYDLDARVQPLARNTHRLIQRSVEMGRIAADRIRQRLVSDETPAQSICLAADLIPADVRRHSKATEDFIAARLSNPRK
ncbi:MAG: GntR family transcriptional regulator [Capsulimonas sp.]|uniref:GntR family transcriptional regulator n=1 Tax=Capsulimonas sp. TaxID=2494211 RepID=UPI0032643CCA